MEVFSFFPNLPFQKADDTMTVSLALHNDCISSFIYELAIIFYYNVVTTNLKKLLQSSSLNHHFLRKKGQLIVRGANL